MPLQAPNSLSGAPTTFTQPQSLGKFPFSDPYNVVPTIEQYAQQLGVDPILAVSIAEAESGLNPTDVGDYGTSFGLYQLHKSGELGDLTPQQAFNPDNNALTALGVLHETQAANPDVTDPGQLAALAQRPRDPVAYAARVNQIYQQLVNSNSVPSGTGTGVSRTSTSSRTSPSGTSSNVPSWMSPIINWLGVQSQVFFLGMLGLALIAGGFAWLAANEAKTPEGQAVIKTAAKGAMEA